MDDEMPDIAEAIETLVKFRDILQSALPQGKDVKRTLFCTLIINKTDAVEVIDAITLLSGE